MKKLFLSIAIVASLAGCAVGGVGQAFTMEQVQQVKPGMTLAQVTDILGPPVHTAATQYGTVISWVYVPSSTVAPIPLPRQKVETLQASFTFKDGKVVEQNK